MTAHTRRWTRRRTGFVAALLTLTLILVGGWLAWRSLTQTVIPFGQASGEIGFITRSGTDWDIALLTPDGVRNITVGDGWDDYFASFDFRGERINFLSLRAGELGPTQIQPDGGGLRTLGIVDAVTTMVFEGRFDWDPSWSADGRRVLWSSLRDLNLELYAADNTTDATPQRLTDDAGRDWFASWSPDGARIAFASDRAGNEDLYLMDSDGSNLRRLTDHPANDLFPVWSLDGETLLFASERDGLLGEGALNLYVIDPDAENPTPAPLGDAVFVGDPTYSADGQEVIYMSNEGGVWTLYRMDADGSNVRRLTDGTSDALFPAWRPALEGNR